MNALTQIRRFALVAALAIPAVLFPVAQAHASAPVVISVNFGPPALPVYQQPLCPGDGYMWTPGYWAWDDQDGYYWVPGVWVLPPDQGLLWTPGYWSWDGQGYVWNEGYWGPEVGFYGGINYGFGYDGVGFDGGYWDGGFFYYNSYVTHVGRGFYHVYSRPVVFNNRTTISFNGGRGGLTYRPSDRELAAARDRHVDATPNQRDHQSFARQNPSQFNKSNHGQPPVPAAATVNSFHEHPSDPAQAARPNFSARPMSPATQPSAQPRPTYTPQPNGYTPANPGRIVQPQPQAQPQGQPERGYQPNRQPTVQPQPAATPQARPVQPQPQPGYQPRPQTQPQPQAQPRPENHIPPPAAATHDHDSNPRQ